MPMALTLLMMAFPAGSPPTDVSPVDTITSSVVGYWLSFGAIAIVAVVLFWLYIWPGKLAQRIREEAREEARVDLLKEIERLTAEITRLVAENTKIGAQRDEAMKIVQDKFLPLLGNFVATTGGMVPVLQQVVALQPLLLQLLNRPDRNPLSAHRACRHRRPPLPGSDSDGEDDMIAALPDDVRELVASVRARAREVPAERDIRALAAEKTALARDDPATVAQINRLADYAALRLEEIADVVAELAELTGSSHGRA